MPGEFVSQGCIDKGDVRTNPDMVDYRFNTLIEGMVVGIHYPGDDNDGYSLNNDLTYDVDPTSTSMTRIRGAPRVDVAAGIDDGDDNILRVATKGVQEKVQVNVDGGDDSNVVYTSRQNMDGDRVLVGFINGNWYRPVIVGVLTHFQSRRGLKDVNGKDLPKGGSMFRRSVHRGTETLVDAKGNVTVTFGKTPDDAKSDKKTLTIVMGDLALVMDNSNGTPTELKVTNVDGSKKFMSLKDGEIVINEGTHAVARVGDATKNGTLSAVSTTPGGPVTFTYVPASGVPSTGPSVNLSGTIDAGADKFKA